MLLGADGKPYKRDGSDSPRGMALPHGWTFIAKYQGAAHTYWQTAYDEAIKHARSDADAMKRDALVMSMLNERMYSVMSLPWHLEVPDDKDRHQRRVCDGLSRIFKGMTKLRRIIWWFLEALWYGRHAVQLEWEWTNFLDGYDDAGDGNQEQNPMLALAGAGALGGPKPKKSNKLKMRRGLTVAQAWPINGDKIGHQEDHTPYVMIYAPDATKIPNANIIPTTMGGMGLLLDSEFWRERIIIHKHLMEDVDYFNPQQAEAIHGVGIRSKIFWLNWLRMEWLSNVTEFFDRVGLGVTIWKYPRGNDAAKQAMQTAANQQQERAHIFVPVDPDSGRGGSGGEVERMEVPTSGADALLRLVEYADRAIERYIIGQEASSRGTASGLGNVSNAEFMKATKLAIVMQDANFLADTMTGTAQEPGLVSVMKKYTYPWADFPVRWVFDVERGESEKKLLAARAIIDMGLKVKAEEIRTAAGFSKPGESDEIVQGRADQQPGMPGGMPGAPPGGGIPPGAPPQDMASLLNAGPPGSGEEAGENGEGASEEEKGEFLQAMQMMKQARKRRNEAEAKVHTAMEFLRGQGRHAEATELHASYLRRKREVG